MNRLSDSPILEPGLESEILQQLDKIAKTGRKFRDQILELGGKLKSFQEAEGHKVQAIQHLSETTVPDWMKPIETKLKEMTNAKRKISDNIQKFEKRRLKLQEVTAGKLEDVLKDVAKLKSLTETTMELKPKLDEQRTNIQNLEFQVEKAKRELREKLDLLDSAINNNQHVVNSSLDWEFGHLTPEMATDSDGWIVIQRRQSGPRDEFERGWTEYENGFRSVNGNFWLGLKKIHELTADGSKELRIELTDWDGSFAYANYSRFSVSNAATLYRLVVTDYSGTAGDSLQYHYLGQFSTSDKKSGHCEGRLKGGWWKNMDHVNLNGLYYEEKEAIAKPVSGFGGVLEEEAKAKEVLDFGGIYWWKWKKDHSLQKVLMKIRQRK